MGAALAVSPVPARISTLFTWLARIIVGGAFAYAGVIKAWDPAAFQVEIDRYRLVPPVIAWLAAAYLPYLEVAAALALFHRRAARAGRLVIAGLLIIFVAALVAAWARGLNISCGCFGATTEESPNYPWWVGRDLLLLAMIGWLHVDEQRSRAVSFAAGTEEP
jgi:putative oxidoreductase